MAKTCGACIRVPCDDTCYYPCRPPPHRRVCLKAKIFSLVVCNTRVTFRRSVLFQTTNDIIINSKSTGIMYYLFYIILIDCYTVKILIIYILNNIYIFLKLFCQQNVEFLIFPGGKS